MNDDGSLFLIGFCRICKSKALGELMVKLYRPQLPRPSPGILDDEVQLGPIEGRFAFYGFCGEGGLLDGILEGFFGLCPLLLTADVGLGFVRITQGDLDLIVCKAKDAAYVADEVDDLDKFALYLVGGAEYVGIILGEAAGAGESMEFAVLFVAVDGAEFGKAQGEISIRLGGGLIDGAVVGAVHRLEEELFIGLGCVDGAKGVFLIFLVVSRSYIEALVGNVGRED